jgi:probable F420-dependent oxidoreductase
MEREFRFGGALLEPASGEEWAKKCERVETTGYDVLLVPDHLGWPAPFPSLVAAAGATERVRLGTFVLNAAFWNPALLAGEVATTQQLTGGRLELGLGTGYVREEFERAGLDYGTPRSRVDHLERLVAELEPLLPEPRPPVLLGGSGDRMLRLAARHAGVVAFTGARHATDGALRLLTAEAVDERVAAARRFAAEQGTDPEFNILVQRVVVTDDREAAAAEVAPRVPHLSMEQLLDTPTLLFGTVAQIAARVRANRERFGFSYVTVMEPSMEAFAQVIEELRA